MHQIGVEAKPMPRGRLLAEFRCFPYRVSVLFPNHYLNRKVQMRTVVQHKIGVAGMVVYQSSPCSALILLLSSLAITGPSHATPELEFAKRIGLA